MVRRADGVLEPIPTFPSSMMVRSDVDAEFKKFARRVVALEPEPHTVSFDESVEVPRDNEPDVVAFTKPTVPRKYGDVLKTSEPVPTSSVMSVASSEDVSIEVLETLPLKLVQSALVRQPKVALPLVAHVSAPAELLSPLPVRSVNASPLMTNVVVVAMRVVSSVIVEDELLMIPPVKVRSADAVSAWSLLRNEVVAIPAKVWVFFASNAAGTAPSTLRGLISPSHAGEPEPPISTPRYKV